MDTQAFHALGFSLQALRAAQESVVNQMSDATGETCTRWAVALLAEVRVADPVGPETPPPCSVASGQLQTVRCLRPLLGVLGEGNEFFPDEATEHVYDGVDAAIDCDAFLLCLSPPCAAFWSDGGVVPVCLKNYQAADLQDRRAVEKCLGEVEKSELATSRVFAVRRWPQDLQVCLHSLWVVRSASGAQRMRFLIPLRQ